MNYEELAGIAEEEFPDVVLHTRIFSGKLRLYIVDGSYIDIWFSKRLRKRFAFHWERRAIDGKIYRYDNRPHEELKCLKGYPGHFHNGDDQNIIESDFSTNFEEALREFLQLARNVLDKR
ncbi:MAG: hypothetical protein K6U04_03820 [Armatimonadetes bacterium]|nr:hypothetical protein [Armatimonadota bacterium]